MIWDCMPSQVITIWQRCSSWFYFWTDQTVLTLPFTHLVTTSVTGDYWYRYLVKNNFIWLLMRYNLKYRDLILRPYPPALLGAYIIIMPATLFCWTNVPKMKLIDGPVMSGSDWLSDCNNIVPHCPCPDCYRYHSWCGWSFTFIKRTDRWLQIKIYWDSVTVGWFNKVFVHKFAVST